MSGNRKKIKIKDVENLFLYLTDVQLQSADLAAQHGSPLDILMSAAYRKAINKCRAILHKIMKDVDNL